LVATVNWEAVGVVISSLALIQVPTLYGTIQLVKWAVKLNHRVQRLEDHAGLVHED
jgi:hypothetical protein